MEPQGRRLPELLSDYLREASVLVLVFGFLDKMLIAADNGVGIRYALKVMGTSLGFFILGVAFEIIRDLPRKGAKE